MTDIFFLCLHTCKMNTWYFVIAFFLFVFYMGVRSFQSVWTDNERSQALELLAYFDKVATSTGARYYVMYGTLLGLVRHGGFIPWDDDMDVHVLAEDFDAMLKLIASNKDMSIQKMSPNFYKVCLYRNPTIPFRDWSWPFLDIFLVDICDDTIFCHHHPDAEGACVHDVFPTQRKQFENIYVSCPRNPMPVLDIEFGSSWRTSCVSSSYVHRNEVPNPFGGWRVPCDAVGEFSAIRRGEFI